MAQTNGRFQFNYTFLLCIWRQSCMRLHRIECVPINLSAFMDVKVPDERHHSKYKTFKQMSRLSTASEFIRLVKPSAIENATTDLTVNEVVLVNQFKLLEYAFANTARKKLIRSYLKKKYDPQTQQKQQRVAFYPNVISDIPKKLGLSDKILNFV